MWVVCFVLHLRCLVSIPIRFMLSRKQWAPSNVGLEQRTYTEPECHRCSSTAFWIWLQFTRREHLRFHRSTYSTSCVLWFLTPPKCRTLLFSCVRSRSTHQGAAQQTGKAPGRNAPEKERQLKFSLVHTLFVVAEVTRIIIADFISGYQRQVPQKPKRW